MLCSLCEKSYLYKECEYQEYQGLKKAAIDLDILDKVRGAHLVAQQKGVHVAFQLHWDGGKR